MELDIDDEWFDNPPPAKRFCLVSPEEKEVAIARPNPASLIRLDRDSLSHLLLFLDSFDMMALIQTGNGQLGASVRAQLSVFCYQADYSDHTRTAGGERTIKRLRWPTLLTQSLPMLRTLALIGINLEWKDVQHDQLPSSLTHLNLRFIRLRAEYDQHQELRFNLPNLTRLSICKVKFINCLVHGTHVDTLGSGKLMSVSKWLPSLLRQCIHLLRFKFEQGDLHSVHEFRDIAKALPHTLEHLVIPSLILTQSLPPTSKPPPPHLRAIGLPPHLHTLRVFGDYLFLSNTCDDFPPLPTSLTKLQLYHVKSDLMFAMLQCAPSTLLHLSLMDYTLVISQRLLDAISRFTQLHTLLSCDPQDSLSSNLANTTVDLSVLPKSLTKLTDALGYYPNEWHHLPPNAELVPADCQPSTLVDRCIEYDAEEEHVENYGLHFPTKLQHLRIFNVIPPQYFPNVWYLECGILSDVLDLGYTTSIFTHISSVMLTHLNIYVSHTTDFFWIPSHVSLPNLERLDMFFYNDGVVSSTEMVRWIAHLPRTLQQLTLQTRAVPDDPKEEWLSIPCGVFPPSLRSLHLTLAGRYIEFPTHLPESIVTMTLHCYGFQPEFCNSRLFTLPKSLSSLGIVVRGDDNSFSVSNSAADQFRRATRLRAKRRLTYDLSNTASLH